MNKPSRQANRKMKVFSKEIRLSGGRAGKQAAHRSLCVQSRQQGTERPQELARVCQGEGRMEEVFCHMPGRSTGGRLKTLGMHPGTSIWGPGKKVHA